ncbi:MAG: TetR/AcrR family transcriptional regulator [Gaiellales bacterium]
MVRSYRQTARHDTTERTRRRILESGKGLIERRGYVDVTIDDVSSEAGVARATIYQHFGSKAGILDACCELIIETGLLSQVRDALRLPDPRTALARGVVLATRFWASEHTFFRAVYAVAAIEPGALRFVDLQRADHHGEMESIVARLAEARALRADLSKPVATEMLASLTGFHFYDELVTHGHMSPEAAAKAIRDLALSLTAS